MDNRKIFARVFLYGLSLAGLFHRLEHPGGQKLFVDERSIDQIPAEEFDSYLRAAEGATRGSLLERIKKGLSMLRAKR